MERPFRFLLQSDDQVFIDVNLTTSETELIRVLISNGTAIISDEKTRREMVSGIVALRSYLKELASRVEED